MARRILSAKIKIQLVPYQTANKIKHPPLNIRSVIFWKDNVTYNKKRGNSEVWNHRKITMACKTKMCSENTHIVSNFKNVTYTPDIAKIYEMIVFRTYFGPECQLSSFFDSKLPYSPNMKSYKTLQISHIIAQRLTRQLLIVMLINLSQIMWRLGRENSATCTYRPSLLCFPNSLPSTTLRI